MNPFYIFKVIELEERAGARNLGVSGGRSAWKWELLRQLSWNGAREKSYEILNMKKIKKEI